MKKILNLIPYLALIYFVCARFFLISENFSFDKSFKNIEQKIASFNIDEKTKSQPNTINKEKNRQKIFVALFSFYIDALIDLAKPFSLNFILSIFALYFYQKIQIFWQKYHHQTRAPPYFS